MGPFPFEEAIQSFRKYPNGCGVLGVIFANMTNNQIGSRMNTSDFFSGLNAGGMNTIGLNETIQIGLILQELAANLGSQVMANLEDEQKLNMTLLDLLGMGDKDYEQEFQTYMMKKYLLTCVGEVQTSQELENGHGQFALRDFMNATEGWDAAIASEENIIARPVCMGTIIQTWQNLGFPVELYGSIFELVDLDEPNFSTSISLKIGNACQTKENFPNELISAYEMYRDGSLDISNTTAMQSEYNKAFLSTCNNFEPVSEQQKWSWGNITDILSNGNSLPSNLTTLVTSLCDNNVTCATLIENEATQLMDCITNNTMNGPERIANYSLCLTNLTSETQIEVNGLKETFANCVNNSMIPVREYYANLRTNVADCIGLKIFTDTLTYEMAPLATKANEILKATLKIALVIGVPGAEDLVAISNVFDLTKLDTGFNVTDFVDFETSMTNVENTCSEVGKPIVTLAPTSSPVDPFISDASTLNFGITTLIAVISIAFAFVL